MQPILFWFTIIICERQMAESGMARAKVSGCSWALVALVEQLGAVPNPWQG
jgi:hypothetical protein